MPVAMQAQLVPLDGGPPIPLLKDLTVVGRKEDCDLRLNHKSISKMHCVIVKTDGLLLLRDLGSTNGTRVNGTRVRRAALLPNDQLSIAGYKYKVHFGPNLGIQSAAGDRTQQIDPGEASRLLGKSEHRVAAGTPPEVPSLPAQPNPLPDVYPNDEGSSHD
jgi:pSer/pThr/pTyr-binding forkhead associated (FHA) protein